MDVGSREVGNHMLGTRLSGDLSWGGTAIFTPLVHCIFCSPSPSSHTLSITLTLSYVSPLLAFSHLLITWSPSNFPKHRLLLGTPKFFIPSVVP